MTAMRSPAHRPITESGPRRSPSPRPLEQASRIKSAGRIGAKVRAGIGKAGFSVIGFSMTRPVSTIAVIFFLTLPDSPVAVIR